MTKCCRCNFVLREATKQTIKYLSDLLQFCNKAEEDYNTPGFTICTCSTMTVGYYYMAHFQGLSRDVERFCELLKRLDLNPLGACNGWYHITHRRL